MRKRDELTDPNSCMSKAHDDEWVFVLRGHDVAAPATVRFWIEERIQLGKNRSDDPQIIEATRWISRVLQEQESSHGQAVPQAQPGPDDVRPVDSARGGLWPGYNPDTGLIESIPVRDTSTRNPDGTPYVGYRGELGTTADRIIGDDLDW